MLLIDPELIRSRLSLEDKEEVNAVLRSAITGATPRLEAVLRTSFTRGAAEDLFYLNRHTPSASGMFNLRLANGFVRQDVALNCTVGDSYAVQDTALITRVVQYERGVVQVPKALLGFNTYLKVSYGYGFSKQAEVPSWLREAMVSAAIKVLSMNAVNDKKDELSKVFAFLDDHADTILNAHLRTGAFLVSPV